MLADYPAMSVCWLTRYWKATKPPGAVLLWEHWWERLRLQQQVSGEVRIGRAALTWPIATFVPLFRTSLRCNWLWSMITCSRVGWRLSYIHDLQVKTYEQDGTKMAGNRKIAILLFFFKRQKMLCSQRRLKISVCMKSTQQTNKFTADSLFVTIIINHTHEPWSSYSQSQYLWKLFYSYISFRALTGQLSLSYVSFIVL